MNHKPIDSLLLLGVTLVLLLLAAYGGKYVFKRRYEHSAVEDDEAKLVLGALLSFLMRLVSLVLIIAIVRCTDSLSRDVRDINDDSGESHHPLDVTVAHVTECV